ncbi:MAG TPA: hypothetical protein PLQ93_11375 [Bacteroidia bacterium]|nr:hypothetical protein [Bacteroidia bacterium]
MKGFRFIYLLFLVPGTIQAQCEIINRIFPDQTMYYYIEPELFFQNSKSKLRGNIITDKNNYFLQLLPEPFPPKEEKIKLSKKLKVKLAQDSLIELEFFDQRYRRTDSSLALMYLIPNKLLAAFSEKEIEWVDLDMNEEKGPRHYQFVLHKAALREQLNCLMNLK